MHTTFRKLDEGVKRLLLNLSSFFHQMATGRPVMA
jgi:hypothetical protein